MSDSVGKITLDLEVTSDLSKQVSAMSNKIGANLKETMNTATKSMFDGMNKSMDNSMKTVNSSLKSGLAKMKETIKSTLSSAFATAKTIKLPTIKFPKMDMAKPVTNNVTSQPTTRGPPIFNSESIKAEMDNVSRTLDNTNAKIEQQQAKLAELKESYVNTFNQTSKNKLEEQILKTESAINGLISKSDKLGFKLADLDAKFASAGTGAAEASSKINSLSNKTKNFTSKTNGSLSIFKKMQNSLKGLGSSAKSTGKSFNGMQSGMGNIAKQFFTWMIILPLIMKGLTAMTTGLLNNLKTSAQFSNSLEQIKTNLMVAFTPIFYAILPAINAFMSALATLTAYIASFISAIFGKTYQQSYQATQGLIDAKEAMGAYGDSAKKAAKDALGLAGIDEINSLSKSGSQSDDSKVPVLTQPSLDMSAVDTTTQGWIEKIKKIMGEIFAPFQEAWTSQGEATIQSMKNALGGVLDVIKAIGKSFFEVWTNGTGTKLLETILQIFQNIFNLIGKIGKSFADAWNKDNKGTKIVQNIADALQNVFDIVKGIGDVLNEVWNEKGDQIAESLTKMALSLSKNFEHLTQILKDIWDSEGAEAFKNLLELISDSVILIADTYTQRISPIIDELLDGAKPVLEQLTGLLGDIFNDLDKLVNYLNGDGHFLIDFWQDIMVDLIVDKFKIAFDGITQIIKETRDILKGLTDFIAGVFTGNWSLAWQGIKEIGEGIWEGIKNSFSIVMDFLKNKLHLTWLDSDSDTKISWNNIKETLTTTWNDLKTSASEKWENIKKTIADTWNDLRTNSSTTWDEIKTTVSQKWDDLKIKASETWADIKGQFNGIIDFVKGTFNTGWGNAWQTVKDTLVSAFTGLETIVKKPINAIIKMVNKLIDGLNSISIDIPDNKFYGEFAGESFGIHIPKIPALATGGIVDSPTLAMVGEAGKEAVMPLENNTGWISELAGKIAGMLGTNNNSVSTSDESGDIIFMLDGNVLGKVAIKQLKKMKKQGIVLSDII